MPSNSAVFHAFLVFAVAALLNFTAPSLHPILKSLLPLSTTSDLNVVKLYGLSTSTCTRRVATVLKEKGVPYELIPIDFGKMEHKSHEYISTKQPFGQVPVLQVRG